MRMLVGGRWMVWRPLLVGVAMLSGGVVPALRPATAAIVYGNLGADGAGTLSSTSTDFGPSDPQSEQLLAQGFTTGSSAQYLTVTSITLGFWTSDSTTSPRTVSIYSDNAGVPGTSLFTSAQTSVGATAKYTFLFSNPVLTPNTSYWVVPQAPSSWYWASSGNPSTPAGHNGSGYAYFGTKAQKSGVWGAPDPSTSAYALSIAAVPEPSTVTSLIAAAVTAAGLMAVRRRSGR